MSRFSMIPAAAALAIASLTAVPTTHAGENFNSCVGFIDSLPATITTQGVWCLRKDLSTAITSGNAITIATNNVTVDCNGFKLGGLAAGKASDAVGIYAGFRQNSAVRNCNIRGFDYGVYLRGAGHLVQDNLFDNNLRYGIHVGGDNNVVQRNRLHDTGGKAGAGAAVGIDATGHVVDNIVSGLFADRPGGTLTGIMARGEGARVHGNIVSGFVPATQGGTVAASNGIDVRGDSTRISGNHVTSGVTTTIAGNGITQNGGGAMCLDNTVARFARNLPSDCNGPGNVSVP